MRMLSESTRVHAKQAIDARFRLRDDVLAEELQRLAAKAADETDIDEMSRMGVRLRSICEHDLFERAFIVWNNLKRAHQECGAVKAQGLMNDLVTEAQLHMKDTTVSLASHLRRHSAELRSAFQGQSGLDAAWLANLRNRAIEKYSRDIEAYVESLSWGLKSLVSGRAGRSESS